MSPAVALQDLEVQNQHSEACSHEIEAMFHRLLEVDQTSPEFVEIWGRVDAYLTAVVAAERSI